MVDVMRISTREQYPPNEMGMDVAEMSSRLAATTLGSIHEELKKGLMRDEGSSNGSGGSSLHVPPRRAFTTSDYLLPTAPVSRAATPGASPREPAGADSYFPLPTIQLPPSPPPSSSSSSSSSSSTRGAHGAPPQPAPPRSYSLIDYEPVPFTHQPGTALQLAHLPAELHYAIFDFLDPIDSVCLALTSRHFYAVHWAMHGRVSLAARREGPNDMEWVWRHAGPFLLGGGGGGGGSHGAAGGKQNSLAMLSPRGQVYCRKCRTARCELHTHIKEWMGPGLEYCVVTAKYGPPAQAGSKAFCFRASPRHPNRCGRHTRNQRAVRLA
ncbi:hypothetical protein F5X97DRAFT_128095 [Nemania serpens]|nr:hypothetical protein F5X97DRAFT_128095 [Nemania serpens]